MNEKASCERHFYRMLFAASKIRPLNKLCESELSQLSIEH